MIVVSFPIASSRSAPTKKPIAVPASPRRMFCPVASAFERSTESVPSTTQNACCTPERSATRTAIARPIAPRTLLWSQTECRSRWANARRCAAASGPGKPAGWRPSSRSSEAPALGRRCETRRSRRSGRPRSRAAGRGTPGRASRRSLRPARSSASAHPAGSVLAPRAAPSREARAATPRRPARAPRRHPDRASSTSADLVESGRPRLSSRRTPWGRRRRRPDAPGRRSRSARSARRRAARASARLS